MKVKTELYNDNFQNYKRYGIPKAQLVIADIPYNLGKKLMLVVKNVTLMVITKKVKARKQSNHFLIQIIIST